MSLLSDIGSAFTSIFTGHGQSALNAEQANQAIPGQDAATLLAGLEPGLATALGTTEAQEVPRQAQLASLMKLNSPGNEAALEAANANKVYSDAARAGRQAQQQDIAGGESSAFDAGNQTAIDNNAASATNQFDQQVNSPEYQTQLGMNRLGLLNQSQQTPLLNDFNSLTSTIYGEPKVQVQPGLGDLLGKAVGGLLGGAGGLFGGSPGDGGDGLQTSEDGFQFDPSGVAGGTIDDDSE